MRLFLVRRTRSFIKKYYAETDPENGRKYLLFSNGRRSYFPDRIPKKVEYDFDPDDPEDQYAKLYSEEVIELINTLNLPRYGLANYLLEQPLVTPSMQEKIVIENLSRAGKRLMGFSRTNLFKRLESSGYSFLLSISRHILRNFIYIFAIENKSPFPIGSQEANMLDEFLEDQDLDESLEENEIGLILEEDSYYEKAKAIYGLFNSHYHNRFDWIRTDLFEKELLQHLSEDNKALLSILHLGKDWNPAYDRQLNALYRLCTESYPDDKILIFTQFADTAYYLFDEIAKRNLQSLACVTGSSDDPTVSAYRFSPISNKRTDIKGTDKEIRVLISTDVLSEGQNLQDGHIVVNYDLPWAIIRLIQRTGRVDRIGQEAEQIVCYSFLPEDGVDRIINLRQRLSTRIRQNAEVVGSDEVFFEGDPINIEDLYNEKAGILDDVDEGEIDLSSYAYQIWKTAIDADPTLQKTIPEMPNVVYGTRPISTQAVHQEGVVVYTRTGDDNDILAYVDTNGNLITQSQLTILKAAKCEPDCKPSLKIPDHHKLVQKSLEYIKEIESDIGGQLGKKSSARYRTYMRLTRHYEEYKDSLFVNELLKKAIDDIYKYPLKEFARDTLNRQLKAGIDDNDLVDLVISLREEERLCVISGEKVVPKVPQIICSLGFKLEKE